MPIESAKPLNEVETGRQCETEEMMMTELEDEKENFAHSQNVGFFLTEADNAGTQNQGSRVPQINDIKPEVQDKIQKKVGFGDISKNLNQLLSHLNKGVLPPADERPATHQPLAIQEQS